MFFFFAWYIVTAATSNTQETTMVKDRFNITNIVDQLSNKQQKKTFLNQLQSQKRENRTFSF